MVYNNTMSALNFPANPADQEVYEGYIYNAADGVWDKVLNLDIIPEGTTNLYFTDQRAIDAVKDNIELDDLSDVDTTGVVDGDALVYDTATTSWVPGSVAIDALDDINDVVIDTPADGEVLTYNQGNWENQAVMIPESRPHPFTMIG